MLASQRALFDLPDEICYLNAASYGPLPLATVEAAREAVARKSRSWLIDAAFATGQYERARKAAAGLIHADPDDVALTASVSYGVATAAKILPVPRGSRVIVLQDDHSSPVLEWLARASTEGLNVDKVASPGDHDWTRAVLETIERPGASPIAIASISSVQWADGGVLDLDRIAPELRKRGAALLVDATHGAGVIEFDVRKLDPDFVVFPTYKWLLGPYGRAFLYVAKRHQGAIPLEQTSAGRRGIDSEGAVYFKDINYVGNARRFDMGERDHFISLEMASLGIERMTAWGCRAISERLAMLTARLSNALRSNRLDIPETNLRAPHIVSIGFRDSIPERMVENLAAEQIYVAPRLGRIRVSPHVFNDESDIDRFVGAFHRLMPGR